MKIKLVPFPVLTFLSLFLTLLSHGQGVQNPVINADVPDPVMIRVEDINFMSSTTMHLSSGLPIMKSKDLVNWQLVNYAYDSQSTVDELALTNGKSTYGKGSWASSLRFHKGIYYVTPLPRPPVKPVLS